MDWKNWGRGAMQKKNAKPNRLHPHKVGGNIALSILLRRFQNNQQDQEAGEELARRLDLMIRSASRKYCSLQEQDRRDVEQGVFIELFTRTLLGDPVLRKLLDDHAQEAELVRRVNNNICRALKNRTIDSARKETRRRGEPLREDGELPGIPHPHAWGNGKGSHTLELALEMLREPHIAKKIPRRQRAIVYQMLRDGLGVMAMSRRIEENRSVVSNAVKRVAKVIREELTK